MANETSSIGINLGSCPSNPHGPAAENHEDQVRMRDQRLDAMTQQLGADSVTDRLLSGGVPSHDHEAVMQAKIATFTTQFNNANAPVNGGNSST